MTTAVDFNDDCSYDSCETEYATDNGRDKSDGCIHFVLAYPIRNDFNFQLEEGINDEYTVSAFH